jgi:arylsulfatase A
VDLESEKRNPFQEFPRMRAVFLPCLLISTACLFSGEGKEAPKAEELKHEPKTVSQSDDGSVLLHSKHVTIHGQNVRYEPQPNKNTVGFWTKVEDWVSWTFTIKTPGTFTLEVLQGCGKGSGGSEVEVSIGDQKVTFIVEDTGHFQNFKPREIGEFKLDAAGEYTLKVKPIKKPGLAVMDLRQVLLKPKK